MTVAVTGATGGVGGRTVRCLVGRGDDARVVALARRPEAVATHPRVEARRADYDDPASLRTALAGVDTLVFVSSDGAAGAMRRHHEHVVAAAVDAGVEHVVYTSILDVSPESPFYYAPVHRETEALLADSGLAHCLARTSIFADFLVSTWATAVLPTGTGRMSIVTRDDVARSLAALALSRETGTVELTGSTALTATEIAEITTSITGRATTDVIVPSAPGWLTEAFTTMFASVRANHFAHICPDITRLTGEPPQSYAAFLRSAVNARRGRRAASGPAGAGPPDR
ncbi:MAG TPA: NAD(P)H-binding protein [Baekduia sp.]|jgi:NAD(P)H dehydrogenase (quinone)